MPGGIWLRLVAARGGLRAARKLLSPARESARMYVPACGRTLRIQLL
jgi:hypothetical protein